MILRTLYDWLSSPTPSELTHRIAVVVGLGVVVFGSVLLLARRGRG